MRSIYPCLPYRRLVDASALTLSDALQRALDQSPTLQAAKYTLRVHDALREQAGLKPAWVATVEAENVLGSGRLLRGIDGLEATLRLGSIIERGDKQQRRLEKADSEQALVVAEQDVVKLDLLAEVARRYIHVVADQEDLVLSREAIGLANANVQRVGERLRAARPAMPRRQGARHSWRGQRRATSTPSMSWPARVALAATWEQPGTRLSASRCGVLPSARTGVIGPLGYRSGTQPGSGSLRIRPAAWRKPDWRWRRQTAVPTSRSMQGSGGYRRRMTRGFVASVSLPFGSAARAAPFEREAQLRSDALGAEQGAKRSELYPTLFALHQELLHARTQGRHASETSHSRGATDLAAHRERLRPWPVFLSRTG